MALLKALCTIESVEQVDEKTAGILTKALQDLEARGFSLARQKLSCAGFENVGGMNHDLVRDARPHKEHDTPRRKDRLKTDLIFLRLRHHYLLIGKTGQVRAVSWARMLAVAAD